jgi:hypothetical protein
MKRPPGNGAAFSLGRIVPTEAKPSELSGEILWLGAEGVKAKSRKNYLLRDQAVKCAGKWRYPQLYILFLFV